MQTIYPPIGDKKPYVGILILFHDPIGNRNIFISNFSMFLSYQFPQPELSLRYQKHSCNTETNGYLSEEDDTVEGDVLPTSSPHHAVVPAGRKIGKMFHR